MLLTWDIFKIASISVSNYDESYSLLSLLRLSWISEVCISLESQFRNQSEPTKSFQWVYWLSFVSVNSLSVSILTANLPFPGSLLVFPVCSSCISIEFHRILEPRYCSFRSTDVRFERFGFAACWSCWSQWRSWPLEFYRTVTLTDWSALRTEDCAIGGVNSLGRSVLAKGESVLLTLCSGFGLLTALLTMKEYELYSKDFDELNAQTEERINQILQHATA